MKGADLLIGEMAGMKRVIADRGYDANRPCHGTRGAMRPTMVREKPQSRRHPANRSSGSPAALSASYRLEGRKNRAILPSLPPPSSSDTESFRAVRRHRFFEVSSFNPSEEADSDDARGMAR